MWGLLLRKNRTMSNSVSSSKVVKQVRNHKIGSNNRGKGIKYHNIGSFSPEWYILYGGTYEEGSRV